MPRRPLSPCPHPGCGKLTAGGACAAHRGQTDRERKRAFDRRRPTAAQRGYDSRWQKSSRGFLAKHPLCAPCQRKGRVTLATLVDHVRPHRGDKVLFWDRANWEPSCTPCHSSDKQREERREAAAAQGEGGSNPSNPR